MITEEEYLTVKREIEYLEKQRNEAIGAQRQLLKELQKEFGCLSIEEAKVLLNKLKRKKARHEKLFVKEFERFKVELQKYNQQLGKDGKK